MPVDYGKDFVSTRDAIFNILSDLEWHTWDELKQKGGIRYSARLLELKHLGYLIQDRPTGVLHGKQYKLESLTPTAVLKKRVKIYLEENDAKKLAERVLTRSAIRAVKESLISFLSNKHKL